MRVGLVRSSASAAIVLLAMAPALAAQSPSAARRGPQAPASRGGRGVPAQVVLLEFDPATDSLRPASQADARLVESISGHKVRLRKPAQVRLRVVHTNTGLYDVAIAVDSGLPPPSATGNAKPGDVSTFVGLTHSYFATLLGGLTPSGKNRGATENEAPRSTLPDSASTLAGVTDSNMIRTYNVARAMEPHLWATDSVTAGPRSIGFFRGRARAALQHLRDTTVHPESVAQAFRDSVGLRGMQECQAITGDTLGLTRRLVAHHDALKPLYDSLMRGLSDPAFADYRSFRDSLMLFRSRADSSIRNAEFLADSARDTEHLVTVVASACSYQESPRHHAVSASASQIFVVKVSRRGESDIAPVAKDLPVPDPVTVTVLPPRPFVPPSVGLSLLAAFGAQFPTYATRTPATGGSQVEIFQPTTTVDARYSWGPTLGLSWRFLDWTEKKNVAIWLPEITADQAQSSSGFLGFGIGSAISWGPVKLGTGMLWVQHAELIGQNVGDRLPNKDFLQTRNEYGHGKWYVSISVFGVPAFLVNGNK